MNHQHLSALDATFVELEDADPTAHMHIGAVLVFDGTAPSQDELLARLKDRLPLVPRLRHVLMADHRPGALHRPWWGASPNFDPSAHVRRAALPAPAGDDELLAWAGDFYSQRLERRRPLWEVVVIEGMVGGRWALASKLHHCLADGVGSLDALRVWADGAEALPVQRPSGTAEPRALDFARAGLRLALHPRQTLERSAAIAELALREEVRAAAPSSLNQPIGTRRRLLGVDVELDLLRNLNDALGGHLNDVVLTVVTAGLRALLQARREPLPPDGLRAMVPVNVRSDDDPGMGNRIASLFVALPVDEADPHVRFERIRSQTDAAKRGHQPAGAAGLLGLGEWLPPILHGPFAQSLFGKRLFNVTVTNVPGPPFAIHAFGSPLLRAIPLVPLAAEHAIGIAVFSYGDRATFGIVADEDSVPDLDVMVAAMQTGLEDLTSTAAAADYARAITVDTEAME